MTVQEFNIFAQTHSVETDALPELNDVALVEVALDGNIMKLNSFGKQIWGWKKGEKIPGTLLSSLQTGKPLTFPVSIKGRTVHGTGVQRKQGWLIVGYHDKNVDSSKRETTYKTLIENIPPLNHPFLDQAPQGILFLDRLGNIIFANQQFKDYLRSESNNEVAQNVFQLFRYNKELSDQLQELLSKGRAIPQAIVEESDFLKYHLRLNASPVHDSRNAILGAILTFEVLPREELSDLPGQDVQAYHLGQLKNVFIAMMSHEIRTPLGVMNGYAEILQEELEEYESATGNALPSQIKEFVGAIHENAQRLLSIVNEMFDLSNMRQLRLSPISLHETLKPVAETAYRILLEKNVDLQVMLAPEDLVVKGNKKRLEQVLKNLISNAIKFTQEGAVTISTRRDDDFVVIEISDTGIGIAQEYLDKLFTPFLQEDNRLNRDFSGVGLGLSLAKLLVDLMHGHIKAESKKGEGSTFRIYLPAA